MKKLLSALLCLLLCLTFISCTQKSGENDGKISIVVTAFPHYDFVRQLTDGVENVEVKMLISPGSEVHGYEPTPSDILSVSDCDMFVYTGGESDTWVKEILKSTSNEHLVSVSFMKACEIDEVEEEHEENGAHHHEDEADEHVWTSPKNAIVIASCLADTLCEIDKDNKAIYEKNKENFIASLEEIDEEFAKIKKDAKRNKIIVADRFPFYYLAKEYGFEYSAAYSGCASSTEPVANVVANLAKTVKEEEIPYVFTIEFSNQKIAKNVIDGSNAKILTLHSCHNVSADDFEEGVTYCDLMRRNAENLRKALCE